MLRAKHHLQRIFGTVVGRGGTPILHSTLAHVGLGPTLAELLPSDARVSEQDADGNTALHLVFLKFPGAEVLDELMDQYVRETTRNLVNRDGLSVVHIMCTRPHIQLLEKVLADGGVDVNEKVNENSSTPYAGYTALHFAVKFEQYDVAEVLRRHNANLHEPDANGSTPLSMAKGLRVYDLSNMYDPQYLERNRGPTRSKLYRVGSYEFALVRYDQKDKRKKGFSICVSLSTPAALLCAWMILSLLTICLSVLTAYLGFRFIVRGLGALVRSMFGIVRGIVTFPFSRRGVNARGQVPAIDQ